MSKKIEKIAMLNAELAGLIKVYKGEDRIGFVCAGLLASAKGTKHYEDAKELVKTANPKYFKDE